MGSAATTGTWWDTVENRQFLRLVEVILTSLDTKVIYSDSKQDNREVKEPRSEKTCHPLAAYKTVERQRKIVERGKYISFLKIL